jgi:membrane carboxypeptidase/penicillin-binding protein PbpC
LGGGEVRLLDLSGAYCAFMNGGNRVDPVSILKVEDADGKILEEVRPKKGKQVISANDAFLIADILSDNNARSEVFGLNSLLNIPGRKIAVKTGTTNDKRDNWTIGGNPQVLVGVWVGNNDNSEMKQVASGISGASPIWRRIILEGLKGKADVDFEVPNGIVTEAVDAVSGYKSHDGFPERMEYFDKGTEPGEDPVHVKLKVCKNDGKLANPADIASGNYEEKEYFTFKEEDPTIAPGQENKWQKSILEWVANQTDPRYHPPTEYCGSTNPIHLQFTYPKDRDSNLPQEFTVKMIAESNSSIENLELYVDGNKLRGFTSPPYEQKVTLDKGTHTLTMKARDANGKESENTIKIGIGVEWDFAAPTPTPTPSISPSPSP